MKEHRPAKDHSQDYGTAPVGCERWASARIAAPHWQAVKERRLAEKILAVSFSGRGRTRKSPARSEQAVGILQRLEDMVGIRQPEVEAEAPGCWTTRMPRGLQNPNRAMVDSRDERVCDGAKNGKSCMCVACVCYGTSLLCKRKDSTCVAEACGFGPLEQQERVCDCERVASAGSAMLLLLNVSLV